MVSKKMTPDEAWANAASYAKNTLGTTMTDLIKRRDAGDKEAQAQINEAYGKKPPRLSKEARAHMKKQKMEMSEDRAVASVNKQLGAFNDATIDVMDAGRRAMEDIKQMEPTKKPMKKNRKMAQR